MSEMVGRLGHALQKRNTSPKFEADWWLEDARIALRAIREPTPEMIEAGCSFFFGGEPPFKDYERDEVECIWQAMIDAALKETK